MKSVCAWFGALVALILPVCARGLNATWQAVASQVESFEDNPNGIIYATQQLGLAGAFRLQEVPAGGTQILQVFGDVGKTVTLSITSAGKYELSATSGGNTTVKFSAVSTTAVTPGLHRFALFIRRGDSSNGQLMKYASIIIDGAETLTVGSDTQEYWTGPFRGIRGGGAGMTISVSKWKNANAEVTKDAAEETLKVEADAAELFPIAESNAVAWSNLEDQTSARATHFTKNTNETSLLLSPQQGVKQGRRVIVTAIKIANASNKTMQNTMTINGATSSTKTTEDFTDASGNATFNKLFVYTFPVGSRPIVAVGAEYPIAISGTAGNQLSAILDANSPIRISGLSADWPNYNGYCAVEGLAALEPEATMASYVVEPGLDYAGGGVIITLSSLFPGTYAEDALRFVLRFDGRADVEGVRTGMEVAFTLPAEDFPAGRVHRGELVLIFPDGELSVAPVKVYGGEAQYVPEVGWVNETAATVGATGTWTAADGIATYREVLEVDAEGGVTFTPPENEDYVALCDSVWTVRLLADEAFDAAEEGAVAEDVQGAVRIVQVAGALQLQGWVDGAWQPICAATPGEVYEVQVAFHYAKPNGEAEDADRVTYTCGEATVTGTPAAGTAAVVTQVELADGTQLAALLGDRELDKVVVEVEILPGETKLLEATDAEAAQAEADRLTIAIGEAVAEVLTTEAERAAYRAYLRVVAKQGEDGVYRASVTFTSDPAKLQELEADLTEAIEQVVAGFSTDAETADFVGRPGLYYGLAHGDEVGGLSETGTRVMAGANGAVSLTITKPAGAGRHFYRVVCSPNANAE